jgi:hypothetical protein
MRIHPHADFTINLAHESAHGPADSETKQVQGSRRNRVWWALWGSNPRPADKSPMLNEIAALQLLNPTYKPYGTFSLTATEHVLVLKART